MSCECKKKKCWDCSTVNEKLDSLRTSATHDFIAIRDALRDKANEYNTPTKSDLTQVEIRLLHLVDDFRDFKNVASWMGALLTVAIILLAICK